MITPRPSGSTPTRTGQYKSKMPLWEKAAAEGIVCKGFGKAGITMEESHFRLRNGNNSWNSFVKHGGGLKSLVRAEFLSTPFRFGPIVGVGWSGFTLSHVWLKHGRIYWRSGSAFSSQSAISLHLTKMNRAPGTAKLGRFANIFTPKRLLWYAIRRMASLWA